MYKHEKVQDVLGYSANYGNFYENDYIEKKFLKNEDNLNKKIPHVPKIYIKKKKRKYFLKTIFSIFILGTGIFGFTMLFNILGNHSKIAELQEYDDFIWPVVLQDPPEFNEKNPLDFDLILRAVIWDASFRIKDNENCFDEEGRLKVTVNEVQNSSEKLFGYKLNLDNYNETGENFFKLEKDQNLFLVNAISADERPIPHTTSSRYFKNKTFLEVQYFIPEKESAIPEKTVKYTLKHGKNGNKHIVAMTKI